MRPVVDVLKLHPESAHVHRQGLALLFNLIAPDPYAKYRCEMIVLLAYFCACACVNINVQLLGLSRTFSLRTYLTYHPVMCHSYSHAQARQMLMANGIVEVIEHAKVVFKKERDIVATTRAMLNIIAVDYS